MSSKMGYNGGRQYSFLNKPVLIDCNFVVDSSNANGLGIRSLKGAGVKDVFMYTSATAGKGNSGMTNPMAQAASVGYALIRLKEGYNRYCGGFDGAVSPVTGSSTAINATALTIGNPYIITSVGHATAGAVTIAPVADVAGSLASTWFRLYDAYGNTFIIWFSVSGVGSAPVGVSGTLVQQSISTGDTAATIGAALVITIQNLASGVSGVYSFTAAGTTTVTVTSTQYGPLPGVPADGTVATGFAFAKTVYNSNLDCWQGVGLPKGIVPAVGASFIASSTGVSTHGGSTGTVYSPGISGITKVEVIGDTNATINMSPMGGSANVGGLILVQFLAPTSTSVTTLIPTAPTNNSVIGMSFYVEASSVIIAGE